MPPAAPPSIPLHSDRFSGRPTFYHLHVHFDHVQAESTRTHAATRARLIDDVIDALEKDGEHFATAAISYDVGSEADRKVWSVLEAAGVV